VHQRVTRVVPPPHACGTRPIAYAGAAGLAVRTSVFQHLPPPWFGFGRVASTDSAGEDTWFYLKALRAGFRVIGDYEARLSHLTTAAVWPEFTAEGLQPRVLLDEWAIRWPEGREAADAELRMHAGLQHLLRSGR